MTTLDRVLAASVCLGQSAMQPLDAYGDITVQHFVDLLSAVHRHETLAILVNELVHLIGASEIDLSEYGAIVSPKLGNTLLGHGVASALRKPSGFIRHSILFGRYIETTELPGAKLLLVDDVSSEAKLLTDCVRNARASGFTIDNVFTVVDRTEGDAEVRLKERSVRLHFVRRCSDLDLAELVRAWKHEL